MGKILVISGTADAVEFIKKIPDSHNIVATTMSKLGEDCIEKRENLQIISGALDEEGFLGLLEKEGITAVVDMSHPFATEVSKNIYQAAKTGTIPYYRFERESLEMMEHCIRYEDFPSAVKALENIKGNLMLTIGSRNLHYFTELPDFSERCYMRVLASSKIMLQLEEMGIDPSHIFAMKGVATKELNIALAHFINASAIITKDSGLKGGIAEKYDAAKDLNIPLIVIDKPPSLGKVYTDFNEILEMIGRD